MLEKGFIQIYTGTGKGKTTAAFGLALRACGRGLRTVIIQFMKPGDSGEVKACLELPSITICAYGSKGFLRKGTMPSAENLALAQAAMDKAAEAMADPKTDIIILDELCNAIYFDLIKEEDALALLRGKRENQEVIITGRNATQALIDAADLVTDMQEIKHPGDAREGIEY